MIEWLGKPPGSTTDAHALKICRSAGALAFQMVPHPTDPTLISARTALEQFWSERPDFQKIKPKKSTTCGNTSTATQATLVRYWWPATLIDKTSLPEYSPGFIVYDETHAHDESANHLAWRRWLWLFNIFQTPESQARFVVVDDNETMMAILNAPLAQWRIFLHPTQRKLASGNRNGSVRVQGVLERVKPCWRCIVRSG
ncbi:hypothetical protein WDW89_12455 [Deltaproteobacteria bacterium TL4]